MGMSNRGVLPLSFYISCTLALLGPNSVTVMSRSIVWMSQLHHHTSIQIICVGGLSQFSIPQTSRNGIIHPN